MKIVIKTCSCFIDRGVWFMNLPEFLPYWFFDSTIKFGGIKNKKLEFLDNYFIKEIRTTKIFLYEDDDLLTKLTIVKSCFDCFKFQVFLSTISNVSFLNDLKYRFVQSDMNLFDNNFNTDIFFGISQSVVENTFYSEEEKKLYLMVKKLI